MVPTVKNCNKKKSVYIHESFFVCSESRSVLLNVSFFINEISDLLSLCFAKYEKPVCNNVLQLPTIGCLRLDVRLFKLHSDIIVNHLSSLLMSIQIILF